MEIEEARMAVKTHALVGTSNVENCLFSTGHLVKEIKFRGKKQFVFRDRWGKITVTRPASQFIFMK